MFIISVSIWPDPVYVLAVVVLQVPGYIFYKGKDVSRYDLSFSGVDNPAGNYVNVKGHADACAATPGAYCFTWLHAQLLGLGCM